MVVKNRWHYIYLFLLQIYDYFKEIDVNIFIVVVDISKPFLSSLSCLATYLFLIQSTDGYKMTVSTQYTIVF